ncbi:MAG: hypothetical protein ACKVS7_14495 [Gemmatimonadaceae bacterium]
MTEERQFSKAELESSKRYGREFGGAMVWYALLIIGASYLAQLVSPSWRLALALVPMVPLWFAMQAALRFFRSADEFARRLTLESVSFAFVAGVMVSMSYGLAESIAHLPRISWTWVPPLFLMLWGLGGYLAHRRYK